MHPTIGGLRGLSHAARDHGKLSYSTDMDGDILLCLYKLVISPILGSLASLLAHAPTICGVISERDDEPGVSNHIISPPYFPKRANQLQLIRYRHYCAIQCSLAPPK